MKKEVKKFLEFNGTTIYFLAANGEYWIAIKPICRALGVDYIRQFKNLKDDPILASALSKQTMQGPDKQLRNYICLPEYFIYGWISQIHSQSPELQKYKWECYRVLYEHFHGTITGRKELLSEKAKAQVEISRCMNTMNPDVAHLYEQASMKIIQINNKLRKSDKEFLEKEKTLFDT